MTKSFSIVIPSYRNPVYLDLCLRSIFENQINENQIIVVLDGYANESKEVVTKYKGLQLIELPQNMGMQYALNVGVFNAIHENLIIINDDNVFCRRWDERLGSLILGDKQVLTINQIEPTGPSMFGFHIEDLGKTPETFQYEKFLEREEELSFGPNATFAPDGEVFPFLVCKKEYMIVGGFDTFYQSPFLCDWDYFLKLELNGCTFFKTSTMHFYHFGSSATKNGKEGERFKKSELDAWNAFEYKWGFSPTNGRNNSKFPAGNPIIKGVHFSK